MSESEEKLRKIISTLCEQLSEGWRSFVIAKNIHQAHRAHRVTSANALFEGIYYACLESAILSLARVVIRDDRGKPINIWFLLNALQSQPDVFSDESRQTVLSWVSTHRVQLQAMESTIKNLAEQRHKTIAHLDKRHVNDPQALYNYPPLSEREIHEAYGLLLGIVEVYAGLLRPSEDVSHLLEVWDRGVKEDVDYLLGVIEKDNEKP